MSAKAPPNPNPRPDPPEGKDTLAHKIYEGEGPESTETNIRFAAYANRLRTIIRSTHRYVAYTSDIGESFRPVTQQKVIRTAYAISWLYLTGDVLHEGYKAYIANQAALRGGKYVSPYPEWLDPKSSNSEATHNPSEVSKSVKDEGRNMLYWKWGKRRKLPPPSDLDDGLGVDPRDEYGNLLHPKGEVPFLEDYRTVMVQRAVFQSLASMALPAFTIHSVVRYSGQALKNHKNVRIRTWGPVGLGLAIVPALPYIFDHPVESAVEWVFEKGYESFTGRKGVHKKEL